MSFFQRPNLLSAWQRNARTGMALSSAGPDGFQHCIETV